ncbi:MAG: tetratricopeptide repeat protein [Candidatus Zixiibacteriota bacterium]
MAKKSQRRSRLVRKWDGRPVMHTAGSGPKTPSLRALRSRLKADPDNLAARLELAERLLNRGKPAEVVPLLDGHVGDVREEPDTIEHRRAVRTLGVALVGLERFDDARRLIEPLANDTPEALDYHYIMAYVCHRLGSDALCERHARVFLAHCDGDSDDPKVVIFRSTMGLRHEILNYLALSLENTGRFNEALAAYEEAIEADRSYEPAWINLVRLLVKLNRSADAQAVLVHARRACPRSQVLVQLGVPAQPENTAPKISLCMIVKNEEEHLPRCLASVQGLADQMVVVDTGSTDRTVEIAQSFGAQVYHHAWEGDFSKARNISMGYADGEWIFILDADEEVEAADIALLREVSRQTDFNVVSVSVYNYSREKGMYTSFLPSIRMFRRHLGAYYEGIVHNQLRFHTAEPTLRVSARLYHYGYGLSPEAMARKVARSRELLEKQLAENPNHAFAHFNLAQLLRGDPNEDSPGRMDRVIEHASRAVALTSPDDVKQRHIHLMALHQLLTAHFTKGEYEQAAACAHRALQHKPGYLDALIGLGHIHSLDGRRDLARRYFLEYLDEQARYNEHAETDHVIILHLHSRHNAYYGLGLVAEMEGKPDEAMAWFEKCVAERDDYIDSHFRLAQALSRTGDKERACQELERGLSVHGENLDMRIVLADLLTELNRKEAPRVVLEEGLRHHPGHVELQWRLARVELQSGRPEAAWELLGVIPESTQTSGSGDLSRLRGDVLYALGRWDEAVSIYETCLAGADGDSDLLNNLGNCHFQLGDFARAESLYRRLIDGREAAPFVYRNLAVALAQQQKCEDAIFTLDAYREMVPEDYDVHGMLGDLYFTCRNYPRAIDHYECSIEHEPDRPDTLTRLGDCYLHSGILASALMGYEAALKVDAEYQPAWERLRAIREQLVDQSTVRAKGRESLTPPKDDVPKEQPLVACTGEER